MVMTFKQAFLFALSLVFSVTEIRWLIQSIPEILTSPDAVVFFTIRLVLLMIVLLYLFGQILHYLGWVDFELVSHDIIFNLPRQILTVVLTLIALFKLLS